MVILLTPKKNHWATIVPSRMTCVVPSWISHPCARDIQLVNLPESKMTYLN